MDLHNSQNIHRCVAEGIGTFWLTFAGCGSAVIAAGFPDVGIGLPNLLARLLDQVPDR